MITQNVEFVFATFIKNLCNKIRIHGVYELIQYRHVKYCDVTLHWCLTPTRSLYHILLSTLTRWSYLKGHLHTFSRALKHNPVTNIFDFFLFLILFFMCTHWCFNHQFSLETCTNRFKRPTFSLLQRLCRVLVDRRTAPLRWRLGLTETSSNKSWSTLFWSFCPLITRIPGGSLQGHSVEQDYGMTDWTVYLTHRQKTKKTLWSGIALQFIVVVIICCTLCRELQLEGYTERRYKLHRSTCMMPSHCGSFLCGLPTSPLNTLYWVSCPLRDTDLKQSHC